MFTGIIASLGTFVKRTQNEFLFLIPEDVAKQLKKGFSIAIDGVCLTVNKIKNNNLYVYVMSETLKKTTLGNLKPNSLVNLELPVTPEAFLSGHITAGHIDGIGKVKKLKKIDNSILVTIQINPSLTNYIVVKGSIAINGVSLTVIDAGKNSLTVEIIPYTLQHTTFFTLKRGDCVNIEVDVIAKYIESLIKKGS